MISIITGNINVDLALNPSRRYDSGTVRFALLQPLQDNSFPVASDTCLRVPLQYDFDLNYDGSFSAAVQSNDSIFPDGTSYKVWYLVPTVSAVPRAYVINGPGPFDIAQMNQEDW